MTQMHAIEIAYGSDTSSVPRTYVVLVAYEFHIGFNKLPDVFAHDCHYKGRQGFFTRRVVAEEPQSQDLTAQMTRPDTHRHDGGQINTQSSHHQQTEMSDTLAGAGR